jgi:hypothetical protein
MRTTQRCERAPNRPQPFPHPPPLTGGPPPRPPTRAASQRRRGGVPLRTRRIDSCRADPRTLAPKRSVHRPHRQAAPTPTTSRRRHRSPIEGLRAESSSQAPAATARGCSVAEAQAGPAPAKTRMRSCRRFRPRDRKRGAAIVRRRRRRTSPLSPLRCRGARITRPECDRAVDSVRVIGNVAKRSRRSRWAGATEALVASRTVGNQRDPRSAAHERRQAIRGGRAAGSCVKRSCRWLPILQGRGSPGAGGSRDRSDPPSVLSISPLSSRRDSTEPSPPFAPAALESNSAEPTSRGSRTRGK